MKTKEIVFSIALLLLSGCGVHKEKLQIQHKNELNIKEQSIEKLKKQVDSLTLKLTEVRLELKKKKTEISWKYTAPEKVMIYDTITKTIEKPFYLLIDGDSIDVSRMPSGSKLESMRLDEMLITNYQSKISELNRKISNLEKNVKIETKTEYKDRYIEKIKEVERQSLQWILIFTAFVVGLFAPGIWKAIWNIIKKSLGFFL